MIASFLGMSNQAPVCLSMILCDSVVIDQGTGKSTILGMFSAITAKSYPAVHPSLHIFAELTDGRGETQLVIKVCRATAESPEGEEVARFEGMLDFRDPRAVLRMSFGIANVLLPQAGEYRFIIETKAGVLVSERRLVALQQP
jgi:hypothetical protein